MSTAKCKGNFDSSRKVPSLPSHTSLPCNVAQHPCTRKKGHQTKHGSCFIPYLHLWLQKQAEHAVNTPRQASTAGGVSRWAAMRGLFTCLALACLAASVAAQQKVLVLDYEHEQEEFSTLSGAPFSFGGASFTVEGERPQPALRTPQDAGTVMFFWQPECRSTFMTLMIVGRHS